jgi:hypothetical protein
MRYIILSLMYIVCATQPVEAAEPRHALVIGNSSYEQRPLKTPHNDAELMAVTLKSLGFRLIGGQALIDASKEEIEVAIVELGKAVRQSKGIAVFYFAGHGVEVGGESYLLPVKMKSFDVDTLPVYSISTNHLLNQLESANNKINLIILDACRDNPFTETTRSMTRGFKLNHRGKASNLILYGTRPGQVSYDGSTNGPFTASLVSNMKKGRGLLDDVLRSTVIETERLTEGKQTPWVEGFVREKFYFSDDQSSAASESLVASESLGRAPQPASTRIADIADRSTPSSATDCKTNQVFQGGLCKTLCREDQVKVSEGCIDIHSDKIQSADKLRPREIFYINKSSLFRKSIPTYTYWGAGVGGLSTLVSFPLKDGISQDISIISSVIGVLVGVSGMIHGYIIYNQAYEEILTRKNIVIGLNDQDYKYLDSLAESAQEDVQSTSAPIHFKANFSF